MSITPAGGWKNRRIQLTPDHTPPGTETCCPRCQSTDWKAARLVYSEGISVSRGRMKGTAIGAGWGGVRNGRVSVGGATIRTRTLGTSQTALSAMAAPPRKRLGAKILLGTLILLFGLAVGVDLVAGSASPGTAIEGLITVILIIWLIRVSQSQEQDYDDATEIYENTRVCQRCGTFYDAPW
jgi:hypothetical protein